jgi:hypothetical protein
MERAFNQEIHEFFVNSPRLHLGKWVAFFLISNLLCTALLLFFLVLASGVLFVQPSPEPSLVIAVQIFLAIVSLMILFLVMLILPFTISTIRRLVSHKPALLITYQGIDFRDLPVTGNIFFPWSEMASLSVVLVHQSYGNPHTYLCLDPKNRVQFLSHFHPLRRLFVLLGSVATGSLISVPQWFLSEPVEEVFSYIQGTFQEKLQTHEIRISYTHSEKGLSQPPKATSFR